MNNKITVPEYLSDKKDELFEIVDGIIQKNGKLHIGAPVGTGKTRFAINLIKHLGSEYKTLFLFPIIAISEQAQVEFENRNIDAEIFNSTVKIDDVKNSQVILSTIDSAYKLINDGFLNESKVLIILDETHTYLQKARPNFSKSVEAILDSGYPIIGLSATPSTWVNHFLFGIDNFIEVEVTGYVKKQINPIEVQNGLLRYVVEKVCENEDEKWIIFLERIKSQKQLKKMIRKQRVNSKVAMLNSETKKSSEKKTWTYLMKYGKFPDKVDIAIINSVAQSGINIKNADIDHVILVDKHDPFGIVQFLGRCREYNGEFNYYFTPGGRYLKQEINTKYINNRINLINSILNHRTNEYKDELSSILGLLGGNITFATDGSLTANKCMIATEIYSLLRDASGERITQELSRLFPDDVSINNITKETGIKGSTSQQQKANRDDYRKELVKRIAKKSSLILSINRFLNENSSLEDALNVISNSTDNLFKALVANVPSFKSVKDKKKLRKILKLADKADRSVQRILTAANLYVQSGKKKSVLRKYINTSDRAIDGLNTAQHLFENEMQSNLLIKDVLDDLDDMIGEVKSTDDWKKYIRSLLGVAAEADKLTERIYSSCLQLKNAEVTILGERKIHRKLVGINRSFQDYIDHKGTLKDFI